MEEGERKYREGLEEAVRNQLADIPKEVIKAGCELVELDVDNINHYKVGKIVACVDGAIGTMLSMNTPGLDTIQLNGVRDLIIESIKQIYTPITTK
jgi:hypothetical protein